MLPSYRTAMYGEWRACERLGIRPSRIKPNFDDNDIESQANILVYGMIRDEEESQLQAALAGAKI